MVLQAPLAIGKRIQALRLAQAYSQRELATRAGVSHGYIALLEKGALANPGKFKLDAVARALGLRTADGFLAADAPPPPPSVTATPTPSPVSNVYGLLDQLRTERSRLAPVYGWGSCGDPRDRESAPDPVHLDSVPLGKDLLIGPRGFGVLVKGESMANRGIHDGDTVWVNPERSVRAGGGVVLARVWNTDGEDVGMVVKVLRRDGGADRLWGDGAGDDGSNPVVGSRCDIVGPIVLVSPAPRPPG